MNNIIIALICLIIFTSSSFADEGKKLNDMRESTNLALNGEHLNTTIVAGVSEEVLTTSVISLEVIILLIILFYWKRTRDEKKSRSNKVYKKNINALRLEKVRPRKNKVFSKRRMSLVNSLATKKINSKTITNTAKKLSIAKGEVFIAAKIKQLQHQVK